MAGRKKKISKPRRPAAATTGAKRPRASSAQPALPDIDAFGDASPHPAWVKRDFPSYAASDHTSGPVASTRVLYAGGHSIEITTTYSVRVDGRVTPVHMMVDTDGRLWSHLCPYRTFANATELLRYLVEHVPEALTDIDSGGHEHGHAGAPS